MTYILNFKIGLKTIPIDVSEAIKEDPMSYFSRFPRVSDTSNEIDANCDENTLTLLKHYLENGSSRDEIIPTIRSLDFWSCRLLLSSIDFWDLASAREWIMKHRLESQLNRLNILSSKMKLNNPFSSLSTDHQKLLQTWAIVTYLPPSKPLKKIELIELFEPALKIFSFCSPSMLIEFSLASNLLFHDDSKTFTEDGESIYIRPYSSGAWFFPYLKSSMGPSAWKDLYRVPVERLEQAAKEIEEERLAVEEKKKKNMLFSNTHIDVPNRNFNIGKNCGNRDQELTLADVMMMGRTPKEPQVQIEIDNDNRSNNNCMN